MPSVTVRFRPQARADLFALYDFVATESGDVVAGAYITRIEAACLSLATFPQRGARRDDLAPGLRTIGFERRALIAFGVKGSSVTIMRILYGGRDFERILRAGLRT